MGVRYEVRARRPITSPGLAAILTGHANRNAEAVHDSTLDLGREWVGVVLDQTICTTLYTRLPLITAILWCVWGCAYGSRWSDHVLRRIDVLAEGIANCSSGLL